MKYRGVTRVITILIERSFPKGPYTLEVVPDYATALPGDTVAWNIQGVPAGIDVTVGNFEQVSGLARVRVRRGIVRMVPQNFPEKKIKKTSTGHTCNIHGLRPGIYKYDVLFNGVTVLDPEIEVPRPGRN